MLFKKIEYKCKLCGEISPNEFYGDQKSKCKKCHTRGTSNTKKLIKDKCVEYKGGKCEKCGYNKCKDALHFHHLDPTLKDYTIGHTHKSFENIKSELDKCIMVCANCHSEIHFELRKSPD